MFSGFRREVYTRVYIYIYNGVSLPWISLSYVTA